MPHVTFIHGIANKPEPDALLRIWRDSLGRDEGVDLGADIWDHVDFTFDVMRLLCYFLGPL